MAVSDNMLLKGLRSGRHFGLPYAMAWLHRAAGIGLLLYLWLHILTLAGLSDPERFAAKLRLFRRLGLSTLEWLLALPVILHAANGGRLILYEIGGWRRDDRLLAAAFCASGAYLVLVVGLTAGLHLQPAVVWWIAVWIPALAATAWVVVKISCSAMGIFWRLQRISGAFLLLLIPAHMLFMHANPGIGHDPSVILNRIRHQPLMRITDAAILLCALYHGAYGLLSILKDYSTTDRLFRLCGVLVIIVSIVMGWVGLRTLTLL